MKFVADTEEFAAQRRQVIDDAAAGFARILPGVLDQLAAGQENWFRPLINQVETTALEMAVSEGVDGEQVNLSGARNLLEDTLPLTSVDPNRESQVERLSLWLAVLSINVGTEEAARITQEEEGDLVIREWVTMQDEDVRSSHRPLHGVERPVGEPFVVAGVEVPYPGAPVGPPEIWLGCRCVLRPTLEGEQMRVKFAEQDNVPVETEDEEVTEQEMMDADWGQELMPVPVHGVLLDTTEETGDGRHLAGEFTVLSVEDGPVPLRWVKSDVGAHDGAVRVGSITNSWMEGSRMLWDGNLLNTPEAEEVMTLLAEGRVGLSVDLDSSVFELDDEDEDNPVLRFTEGRIRAATLVDIPALTSAWAQLGSWEDTVILAASGCAPCREQMIYRQFAISEADWDGSPSRFTDEEWERSTVVDRGEGFNTAKERYAVPIREPNGDLSRAAVHNAAARINQVDAPPAAIEEGKRALVRAYGELDEEPPESLTASSTFQVPGIPPQTKDAPGWITHPRETSRLRRYWTEGPGAAKIRWGTPGDFNRCRSNLAKYVQRPDWLAGLCANMHFDALGFWPGSHRARSEDSVVASSFKIYEGGRTCFRLSGLKIRASRRRLRSR